MLCFCTIRPSIARVAGLTKTKEAYRIKGRQKTSQLGPVPRRAVACTLQSRFARLRVTRVIFGQFAGRRLIR